MTRRGIMSDPFTDNDDDWDDEGDPPSPEDLVDDDSLDPTRFDDAKDAFDDFDSDATRDDHDGPPEEIWDDLDDG